ncbi:hypothetical protein N0V85_007572, partial [Neurospora sp. IMI 360204]
MKPTNTSKSGGANEVTHGMATLSINPSQPPAIIMHPRADVHVAARSDVGIAETSAKHTQSSPLRPSTQTTEATMPGPSSSPAGPKVKITFIHPSRTQEAEHFPRIRQHPHPFPGHYKTHRHRPTCISQAVRGRPCEKHTAAHNYMRNRHSALMAMGNIRNRMKLEHMREQRRGLIAKLRAINARVDTLQSAINQELALRSLSSLSLTGEPKKRLSAPEDDLEHLLAGIRERTGL